MVNREHILSFRQVFDRLAESGGSCAPSHAKVVGMVAVGKGGHKSEVVVGVAVLSHQELSDRSSRCGPSRRALERPSPQSVGSVCHLRRIGLRIRLKGRVGEILSGDILLGEVIGKEGCRDEGDCPYQFF